VRRLDLNKDVVNEDGLIGPTTRFQWCQQWLKTENSKENSNPVSIFNRMRVLFACAKDTFVTTDTIF
jgi:hypothetical protein